MGNVARCLCNSDDRESNAQQKAPKVRGRLNRIPASRYEEKTKLKAASEMTPRTPGPFKKVERETNRGAPVRESIESYILHSVSDSYLDPRSWRIWESLPSEA